MEIAIVAGNQDAGLHLHRHPCAGLTQNAAIWAERRDLKMWRLDNVQGRVERGTRIDAEPGLYGDENPSDPDVWISTRVLPKGWYEIEYAPLPGMTRPQHFYIEIERYGGPSFLARILDNRKRLELIVQQGWS